MLLRYTLAETILRNTIDLSVIWIFKEILSTPLKSAPHCKHQPQSTTRASMAAPSAAQLWLILYSSQE